MYIYIIYIQYLYTYYYVLSIASMIPGEETHAKRHAHCMHIKCAWKVN